MNPTLILAVLLGVVVIVGALQTFQLVGLTSALSTGVSVKAPTASASSSASSSPSASSSANSLADLPSMVGGC